MNPKQKQCSLNGVTSRANSCQLWIVLAGLVFGYAGAKGAEPISWGDLGAKAGAGYVGDGLTVVPTASGARLCCVFQKLEGEATADGLRLVSSVAQSPSERFRVVAAAMGREAGRGVPVSGAGNVVLEGRTVRFVRPGLVEEYSVSVDGVRQDFIVLDRPVGEGELVVHLAVSGARLESASFGVRLVLAGSGRKIAYSRLRVTDAAGRNLPARLQVEPDGTQLDLRSPALAVLVNDAEAVYPVRIDPTFSDENWVSLGGVPGTDSAVLAAVVDGTGNLYIGGNFSVVGETVASGVAKWDGSHWSALGSGLQSPQVSSLAVSGPDLYAGGNFGLAGGIQVDRIARWNGTNWSALGSGVVGGSVRALAVIGTNVYAGGDFTSIGGVAGKIAQWNGSIWSAMGPGVSGTVHALTALGPDLFAGGLFSISGVTANSIAKWDGTNWSALGPGVLGTVRALAASGSDLYVGGTFLKAGSLTVNRVARWNGSSWSAVGSGLSGDVYALTVVGAQLYVGGAFTNAGGMTAKRIARWDGTNWSALAQGVGGDVLGFDDVYALAMVGTDLYAGGGFANVGTLNASQFAKWDGNNWSAIGSGINSFVRAVAISGPNIYVGGTFTSIGGIAARRVAKWDGAGWSALGLRWVSA